MTSASGTLVLQSHRQPLPAVWLERCLETVQAWAAERGYRYRYEGDELLGRLDPEVRARTAGRPVIAADLARLAALQRALAAGFDTVVWLDADTLVLDSAALELPADAYALGREVWVQPAAGGGVKTYVKVHNAFLLFRPGNPFLDFYRHAAERIVLTHQGPMAPQLVGPKLLTALHNLVRCPVGEQFGMLSPAVARDVLAGGGQALEAFRAHSTVAPAAVNLCGSLVGREIAESEIVEVIDHLLEARSDALAQPWDARAPVGRTGNGRQRRPR
jgi:hypothetical protein